MATRFQPLGCVLLIDDDRTTNHVNQRLLKSSGIAQHVDVSLNGREALDYLANRNSNAGQCTPEVIFLDVKMPVMDGFLFLDLYSELPPEQRARVLLILSSAASFYDQERLKTYPAVIEYLDKPLEQAYLRELLRRHFPERIIQEI